LEVFGGLLGGDLNTEGTETRRATANREPQRREGHRGERRREKRAAV
jgi:hypothetical protein